MTEVLRFAILGVGAGGIYALVALGLVLVHQGTGVVNFAHGAIAVIGGLLWMTLDDAGVPQVPAALLSILGCAALGVVIHLVVMRPMSDHPVLLRVMATLGIAAALVVGAGKLWGTRARLVDSMLPDTAVTLPGDIRIGADRLWVLGIAIGVTAATWLWTTRARTGLAVRASGDDPDAVVLVGWSPGRIGAITWGLGAAMAGLAGVLIAPITGLEVNTSSLILVPALAAALVGGLRRPWLTLAGAVFIGVAESLVGRYTSTTGLASAVPLLVVVVLLAARGNSIPDRSERSPRLPTVTLGRVGWVAPVVLAAVVAVTLLGSTTLADAVTASAIAGLLCCSVVVITGFAGQLNLAPLVLAGIGALAASHAAHAGWPFPLAVLAGAAAAVPAGLVVAAPALRSRGTSLAVATLALGVMVQSLVFGNTDLTGGMTGVTYEPPALFGVEVDAVVHPQRFAAVAAILFAAVAMSVTHLRRLRIGQRMLALRSNERAALSTGIATRRTKLAAFAACAAVAGVAGALDGLSGTSATFSSYTALGSTTFLSLAVIGGVGYASGSALGGAIAVGGIFALALSGLGGSVQELLPLASAVLMVSSLVSNPNGVAGKIADRARRRRKVHPTAVDDGSHRDTGEPVPSAAPAARVGPPVRPPTTASRSTSPELRHADSSGLEVEGLTVRYGGVTAVEDVSFRVKPGEILGVIGPNGAGKSSLIDAICGFTPVAAGGIILEGRSIDRLAPHLRARAGLVRTFQSMELFDDLTVMENLSVPSSHGIEITDLPAMITELGLDDDLDRLPVELPMGRRRLVTVARALATAPTALLLDEPAVGVHGRDRDELARVVRGLADRESLAVVLVEHDTELVFSICDHVMVLDGGRVLAEGSPADVRVDPDVVAAYLGTESREVVA